MSCGRLRCRLLRGRQVQSNPRRGGRPLAPPLPRGLGALGAGEAEPGGRILTSVQGRVIIGVCQRRGCPEPSQCGAARRQGGGGMKHGQDRKQSQQVTWQVLSKLCNESRAMCDAFHTPFRPPPPTLFFLKLLGSQFQFKGWAGINQAALLMWL